ncbi:hypothetical protein [Marinobacter salicampi]|uniref:hypothetical protein n=1 Tax=Marinobacter salicampi TaxID=435907 RepID=UPI0014086CEC|nr:hypothetical protein [Marinobacter salicampi]
MPEKTRATSVSDIDTAWGEQSMADCLDHDPQIGSDVSECMDFPPLNKLLSIQATELKRLIFLHGQSGCGGILYLRGAHIRGHLNLEGLSACNGASLPRLYLVQCLLDDGISFKGAKLGHISLRGSRFSLDRNNKDRKFGDTRRHIVGDYAEINGEADLSNTKPLVPPATENDGSKSPAGTEFPDGLPEELKHVGSQTLLLSMRGASVRGTLRIRHTTFAESADAATSGQSWSAMDLSWAVISGTMRFSHGLVVHGGIKATGLRCEGEAWFIGSTISHAYIGEPENLQYRHAINLQSALFQKSLVLSQDSTSPQGTGRSIVTGFVFLHTCTVNHQLLIEGVVLRYSSLIFSGATLGALSITSPEASNPKSKFSGSNRAQTDNIDRWNIEVEKGVPARIGSCLIQVEPGTAENINLEYSEIGHVDLASTERSGPVTDCIRNINLSNTICSEVKIGGSIENRLNLSKAKIAGDCIVACSVPRALLNQAVIGGSLDLKEWSTREASDDRSKNGHPTSSHSGRQSAGDLPQLDIQNARIGAKIDVAEFKRIKAQSALDAKLNCYPDYKITFSKARIVDGENESLDAKEAFLAFLEGPEGEVLRLDGSSSVFHDLNMQQPPRLETGEQVIEFLVLFCAFTWADGGPFRVFSRGSICANDKDLFDDQPEDDLLSIQSTSLKWKVPGGRSMSFNKFQWSTGTVSESLKVIASPKAYPGITALENGLAKDDFKELPLFRWPTEEALAAESKNTSKANLAIDQSDLNTELSTLIAEYKLSEAKATIDNKSERDIEGEVAHPDYVDLPPEIDCWFVVASVWYEEKIFACLFLIKNKPATENKNSEVAVSMLGEFPLVSIIEPKSTETSPKDAWLPWVGLKDYEAFEQRKGGQAALVTLTELDENSEARLDVENYLGTPFEEPLVSDREARSNGWWDRIKAKIWSRQLEKQENCRKNESAERALWKGWGWSRKAYVDLSGSKCRVLADVSGRGWGDSIYFKTDRFEFETVARKEFSHADNQREHSPGEILRLILNEFKWRRPQNSARIDYTNKPNMSYYEQRLLWLSRYRMNDQSALETPDTTVRAMTDSHEDDINRWFEPGTFRSFARVYRQRSLDQGAVYLDESLMRLKSWHFRWHLRHLQPKTGAFTKRLLAALAILIFVLASYLAGMVDWMWSLSAFPILLITWCSPLTKIAMLVLSAFLSCWDTLFRWGFRYGLSLIRPLVIILILIVIGWWSVNYLDNRGFMIVESLFVSNHLAPDRKTSIFAIEQGLSEPVASVRCGSNIDHGLYALDKLIPLIEIDQDKRCLIRPFDANRDIAYSALVADPWYRGSAPDCASGNLPCNLLYPFEVMISHPTTWRTLQAFYVILGWVVISATLLTFSGVLRKQAEGR